MKIISLDPGKHNFGFSKLTLRGKLLKYGMIRNTIIDLKGKRFHNQLKKFIKEIEKIIDDDKCIIVIERFLVRGRFRGSLNELINIMIGIICHKCKDNEIVLIAPSTWKNHYNRIKINKEIPGVVEHISDSILLGLYFISKKMGWDNHRLYKRYKKVKHLLRKKHHEKRKKM